MPMDCILTFLRPSPLSVQNQIAMTEGAHQLGYGSIAIVPRGESIPPQAADGLYECSDFSSRDEFLDLMGRIARRNRIARIFPLYEQDVGTAALCRERFDIPGIRPEHARLFRDKNDMHAMARNLGVRTARECVACDLDALVAFVKRVGFPIVIKPRDGSGCRDTHRIDDEE